jgi:hypothetical protein
VKNFAVLIVAFRRPNELAKLVKSLSGSGKKVYVYVDFDENLSAENQEVIQIAKKMHSPGEVNCLINSKNVGVGRAVPTAINWSLESENYVLVLEDDCELGEHALSYFSNTLELISGDVAIVSGRSAWPEEVRLPHYNQLTLTNLPLTNGFLVSKQSWELISRSLVHPRIDRLYLISILKNPAKILLLNFIYSACLINSRIATKAWDCFIAFEMLASNLYSVNPNLSAVTTRGIDDVASNTKLTNSGTFEYIVKASSNKPSEVLDKGRSSIKLTNHQVSKKIYNVKIQNLFSPLKSWLKIFKYKFL